MMPSGRFVTTYRSDYRPFSERHPQVNQMKPRTEAKAAPAFIISPQTDCVASPVCHHYFYKTSNSTYGLGVCSQPPPRSLFPAFLSPYGTVAGTVLTEARTQEVGVARETGPPLGKEDQGQLRCVFGGEAKVLEQQEAEDEPQQKTDVLFEEGVIVLSSHACPECCEYFLREARLQHPLHLPVTSIPVITTIKDPESWDNSAYPRGLRPAAGLKNGIFLQHAFRRGSCAGSLARVQPMVFCTEPSKKPWLTEYQDSYTAVWARPKIQQSDFHHHPPPRQHILHLPF